MSCVTCNTPPAPCDCKPNETCVQTSRNCTTCPLNICIPSSSSSSSPTSKSNNIGPIVGGALGGVFGALALFGLGWFLFRIGLINRVFSSLSSHKKFKPKPFHHAKGSNPDQRRSKVLSSSLPGSQQIGNSPSTSELKDVNHQKSGSTSSRRISETVLNKRNSAHMMDIIDPDVHDLKSYRSGELLSLNVGHNPDPLPDDDPFSDRNSRQSATRQLPPLNILSNSPLLGPDQAHLGLPQSTPQLSSFSPEAPNSIPVAYIPPTSKSLSIEDVDDRDGFGNSGPLTSSTTSAVDPVLRTQPSILVSSDPSRSPHHSPSLASALRSSFLPHNTGGITNPPPFSSGGGGGSGSGGAHRPIRPPRAPDLDLRLPTVTSPSSESTTASAGEDLSARPRKATFGRGGAESQTTNFAGSRFSVDSSLPRHSVASFGRSSMDRWSQPPPMPIPNSPALPRHRFGSNDGMPPGSRLTLDSSPAHHSFLSDRPISNISDATTHDSHLSSILDPAMIVTPVTLVRTASGRQAAVHRVALRGQEKARVVRLNRNSSVNCGTFQPLLPNQTNQEAQNVVESPQETLTVLPGSQSPSTGRSPLTRYSSILPSSIEEDEPTPSDSLLTVSTVSSTVHTPTPQSRVDSPQSSVETTPGDPFTDSAAVEVIRSPSALTPSVHASEDTSSSYSCLTPVDTHYHRHLNTTPSVYVNSSEAISNSNLSVKTPSVHSTATTTYADHGHGQANDTRPQSTAAHSTAAVVGCAGSPIMAPRSSIATSSINGEESFMNEPLPSSSRARNTIPDDISLRSRSIYESKDKNQNVNNLPTLQSLAIEESTILNRDSMTLLPPPNLNNKSFSFPNSNNERDSVVSTSISVRSGYGSVLEGIPFNIGFNSTGDDGFGGLGDLTGVEEDVDVDEIDDVMHDMRIGMQFIEQNGDI
ncbi:hypothetical protein CROQUDRAFT_132432 [Cronartium quercuum f. sp. fusiforme G11]|uniref:Membrane anchor Opy2 N-terminal domain-containing protein n=1 Tax=Cronartium quercuum f. sp. fusiforme G11 TaxID=708437 RepID=A0A9P6NKJ7_9BASI|nr:hypothetical protein CROQUDRAFT_132432 [Cronartium quercuum f. sp. fusiforme G11]